MTSTINKSTLVKAIVAQLQCELDTAIKASQAAHESATHSENVAENKYDTLGLEAAYLAHGQSLRIAELQSVINQLENYRCPTFNIDNTIAAGALVTLLDDSEQQHCVFISPSTGAMTLTLAGQSVQVVSVKAPLGTMLNRKYCGDEIVLTINGRSQCYDIVAVQ